MHIAHKGNRLDCGHIIICLNIYTPMTYTTSGQDNPQRSPAIVIHTYSKIGYSSISHQLNPPVRCIDVSMTAQIRAVLTDKDDGEIYFEDDHDDGNSEWEPLLDMVCTPTNRYCTKYGVSTVLCVCKTDPVDRIDLELVR